jgi:hypothetical protein
MSAVSIWQAGQPSTRRWAWLGALAVLVAGCHAQASHGPFAGQQTRIGFLPLLICLAVFFLILFVKRPWRVLGGLALAFVVFVYLRLAIPAHQARRHVQWTMHPAGPTMMNRQAVVGPGGQVIWQGWDEAHAEMVVDTTQPSAAVSAAIAVSGDEHADEEESPAEHAQAADHADHAEPATEQASGEAPPALEVESAAPPIPEPQAPPAADTETAVPSTPQVPPEVPADAVVVQKAPDWIKEPGHFDPQTHRYVEVVRTGTATTPFELKRKLDERLAEVTRVYLADAMDDPRAEHMRVPLDYLYQKVVKQQHTEAIRRQFDAPAGFDDPAAVTHVQETWARLEFGPEVRRDLALMWDQEVAQRRLWQIGGLGGLVMAVLASALGYLRLDTATKGYYTRTLRWGAATVILGLVAAGLLLAG